MRRLGGLVSKFCVKLRVLLCVCVPVSVTLCVSAAATQPCAVFLCVNLKVPRVRQYRGLKPPDVLEADGEEDE